MLGTVGEHDRLDTTVISDAVNTASRLQSLSAHYSCSILVSEAAAGGGEQEPRAESGYYVRFVDEVRLKGKGRPVKIYEVRGGEADEAQRSVDELYRRAFEALALREADAARELLERCLAAAPEDPVYGTLALRIERFRRNGFPEDWDGVTNHAFK